jgi:hypothetical protein
MLVGPVYVFLYVLGDCTFFFLQKAARDDIRYWIRIDGWAGTVGVDIVAQVTNKIIADYTGLVQFRLPGVIGGSYWTGNTVSPRERES